MRLFVFLIAIVFSSNSFSIGPYATLTGDQKLVADRIKDTLQISEEDAYQIYQKHLEPFVGPKSGRWNYYSSSNETLTNSKLATNKNKMLTFDLVDGDGTYNLTLIKFADANQVLVHIIETLPRSADTVIKRQTELKKDPKYSITTEDASFTAVAHKEKAAKVVLFAKSGVGAIQYVTDSVFDLSKPLSPQGK